MFKFKVVLENLQHATIIEKVHCKFGRASLVQRFPGVRPVSIHIVERIYVVDELGRNADRQWNGKDSPCHILGSFYPRKLVKLKRTQMLLKGCHEVTQYLPDALYEACRHAYHPGLFSDSPEGIVHDFLWNWGDHPADPCPEHQIFWELSSDGQLHCVIDVFVSLQRALQEGEEQDRAFALFLLGGLHTPEARTILYAFLASPHRKERWASTITLGRLKEVDVFLLLQNLLLEGFWPGDLFPHVEDLQEAQKLYHKSRIIKEARRELENVELDSFLNDAEEWEKAQEEYRNRQEAIAEQKRKIDFSLLGFIQEQLYTLDYEWYLYQRAECALVLGSWGQVDAVQALKEALNVAWNLEKEWPDYSGLDLFGPEIWYFFEDRLLFALGQLGDAHVFSSLRLPEDHLSVARIYWSLGRLEIQDDRIFSQGASLFDASLGYGESLFPQEEDKPTYLYVEPKLVQQVLAEYFDLSTLEQDTAIIHWREAWVNRRNERLLVSPYNE